MGLMVICFSPIREVGINGEEVKNAYTSAEDQGRYFGNCFAKVLL